MNDTYEYEVQGYYGYGWECVTAEATKAEAMARNNIVAGIAGNSGNQTTTLIIRSLALGQVTPDNARRLIGKELGISLLNGVVWGGVAGIFAYLLYHSVALGLVMTSAMLLNLLVAALVGMIVPLVMQKMGRDPAIGSSVLLTFTTDSMGFFIFLGLATVFLV
jgi:magnesium transporter